MPKSIIDYMPKPLHQRLRERGWSEDEISSTIDKLYDEEKQSKHAKYRHKASPIVFWAALVIAIIGNLLISVIFIPFLMFLNGIQAYIILGTMALIFGAMFNHLLRDIEHVDNRHHIYAGAVIPALAIVTVSVIVTIANVFNSLINNPLRQNQFIISLVYFVAFSAPYAFYKYKDLKEHKNREEQGIAHTDLEHLSKLESEELVTE